MSSTHNRFRNGIYTDKLEYYGRHEQLSSWQLPKFEREFVRSHRSVLSWIPDHGAFYFSAATAYGEMRYNCPGVFISGQIQNFSSPQTNWLYQWVFPHISSQALLTYMWSYNVTDPAQVAQGLGVPHTVELVAIWGLNSTTGTPPASYFTTNAAIVPVMQGYWTSFIRSLDPNTFRATGTPEWLPFDGQQRILFETNATRMETIPADQQERCDFLASIAVALEQ